MLSKKCKYAIKAVMYLARHQQEDRAIFSTEIAEKERIPRKFLETILRELSNLQILQSRRGKTGGYRLLKHPEKIKLSELMRMMDGPIALLPCVSLNYYAECEECVEVDCQIKNVFERVRDKTLEILNETSIASISASLE